jgi:hypothetical protein
MVRVPTGPSGQGSNHTVAIIEKRAPAVLVGRSRTFASVASYEHGSLAPWGCRIPPGVPPRIATGGSDVGRWPKAAAQPAPHAARDRQATLGVIHRQNMVGGDGPVSRLLRPQAQMHCWMKPRCRLHAAGCPEYCMRLEPNCIESRHGVCPLAIPWPIVTEPPPVPQDYAREFPASRINRKSTCAGTTAATRCHVAPLVYRRILAGFSWLKVMRKGLNIAHNYSDRHLRDNAPPLTGLIACNPPFLRVHTGELGAPRFGGSDGRR